MRDALSEADRRSFAEALTAHLLTLPWFQNARRIALFAARGSEVNIDVTFAALRQRGVTCCFPRVEKQGDMAFVDVAVLHDLQAGSFGVREPVGSPVDVQAIDVVVLPGLAFDRAGQRLGYGAGYYDRALKNYDGICVGVCYAQQVVHSVPTASHDRAVDVLVTQSEILAASARARAGLLGVGK